MNLKLKICSAELYLIKQSVFLIDSCIIWIAHWSLLRAVEDYRSPEGSLAQV